MARAPRPVLSDGVGTMVPGISERTNGSTKFSHLDRLGTNAKTTDAGGAVVDSRRYDAFGLPISITNPTNSQKGFASAFGYQEDSETGLKLMGHRYYDPGSGRFITRDPIGSGTNWYKYADNNPLKSVDPDGLTAQSVQDYDAANHTGYTDRVKARIKSLSENGEVKAAKKLQEMLDAGKIMVDDDPKAWRYQYPDGRPFIAAAKTASDGSYIVINPNQFGVSEYLESDLLHEVYHVFCDEAGIPSNEQISTRVTAAYARRRAAKARDGSDAEWKKVARANEAEAAGFASRDRGRFSDFFKKLFGGFPWR